MSLEKARDLIVAERGEHFDPLIVDVFGHCLQDFFEVKRAIDNGDHGVFEASYGNRMDIDSIVGAVNG